MLLLDRIFVEEFKGDEVGDVTHYFSC